MKQKLVFIAACLGVVVGTQSSDYRDAEKLDFFKKLGKAARTLREEESISQGVLLICQPKTAKEAQRRRYKDRKKQHRQKEQQALIDIMNSAGQNPSIRQ